jgi:twinkle protein
MNQSQNNSSFVRHEPCPNCNSKDNLARFSDGHGYCFGCRYYEKPSNSSYEKNLTKKINTTNMITGEHKELTKRNINITTCKFFDYQIGEYKNQSVHIAPYYNSNYELVAQHIRFPNKDFIWLGDVDKVELFGQHKWKGNQKMIVITEGELDCLSVSQIQKNKWPVVSVPSGAQSAKKYIKKSLEYLESFESVVLLFDNDDAGNKASIECAQLFTPKKAKIAKLPLKDANEMLVANREQELINSIWAAKPYSPEGIISGEDCWDYLVNKRKKPSLPYPWNSLNKKLKGIRQKEILLLTAGSGTGKSQVCRELAYYLIINNKKVGYIALEEDLERSIQGIVSVDLNKRVHDEDIHKTITQEEFKKSFDKIKNNVFFFKHFGSTESDNLLNKIRYLIRGCDCDFVILDHINIVVSALEGDERKLLDATMTNLRTLVEELNFGLILVCHLKRIEGKIGHEEGAITSLSHLRGSHSLAQLSDVVIGFERNQQSIENQDVMTVRVLKNRYNGDTGISCLLHYNRNTGRLSEGDFENEVQQIRKSN